MYNNINFASSSGMAAEKKDVITESVTVARLSFISSRRESGMEKAKENRTERRPKTNALIKYFGGSG